MNISRTSLNVVIVDDDRLLGRCLRNYLVTEGHACTYLPDGKMMLRWLENAPCDVIVMDLKMPETDGIGLAKMIREQFPSIPILIWTGLGYEEPLMEAARKVGVNGFLSKVMGPKALQIALLQMAGEKTALRIRIAA